MNYERKVSRSMLERKKLAFPLELKTLEEDGRFAGYASVFNVIDNQRDVIVKGAFVDTVKNRVSDIKLLWQHQMSEPIGLFDRIFEDHKGLYVEGRLLLGLQRAREAYTLLKQGIIGGLSIGYSAVRYTVDPKAQIRQLKAVQLWEISLVTFPANPAALVTVVKNAKPPLECKEWESAQQSGQLIGLCDAIDRAIRVIG